MRAIDRRLQRPALLQHAKQGLGGEVNDHRAAGAAHTHEQLPRGFVKHQGGRHGRAWSFTGLHAVGHHAALGIAWHKAEVSQLVVEQKAFHHLPRAKGIFQGGGHGHGTALRVHDAEVRGAHFGLLSHGRQVVCSARHGLAGGHLRSSTRLNQLGARLQIIRLQQTLPVAPWSADEIGVGHILRAVCKGQT